MTRPDPRFVDDEAAEDLAPADASLFELDREAARTRARGYQQELIAALAAKVSRVRAGKKLRITVATGGGKTRIANDWIWKHALPAELRVLWVTKDWTLLQQAASDLCRRYAGARAKLGYVGTQGRKVLAPLHEGSDRPVVYTTIHSWNRRADDDFADTEFDVVIVDESHWGEGQQAYDALHARYDDRAVFVGLTATPRAGTEYELVGEAYDYPRLAAMQVLAQAVCDADDQRQTGVHWSPVRSGTHGDFTAGSLRELAEIPARNRLIVERYLQHHRKYGKTLVFACNIDHAECLAKMFDRARIAARVVHSLMPVDERRAAERWFRESRDGVLVNVAMMTHGVDVPDIQTIFLARPTTSRTLFAQMVGRGARRAPNKSRFHVVDFTDSLDRFGDALVTAQEYFGDAARRSSRATYRPAPRRARHEFEPSTIDTIPLRPGFEAIAGLDFAPGQTFGIELELTRADFDGDRPRDFAKVARELLQAIPEHLRADRPLRNEAPDHRVWNVGYDRSCGWEVTSRVLSGAEGFFEVLEVVEALEQRARALDLLVDYSTGAHVHLGWRADVRKLRRLVQLVTHYEPALHTVVAPSRAGNHFCQPLRPIAGKLLALESLDDWIEFHASHERRYRSVNLTNLFGDNAYGTVEIRLHNGTLEGPKVLTWLSLWMRILSFATSRHAVPEASRSTRELPLSNGEQGDILALADAIYAGRVLHDRLATRRQHVIADSWMRHADKVPLLRSLVREWATRTSLEGAPA